MTKKIHFRQFLIMSTFVSTGLLAHDLPATKCIEIIDNMERLTCYDKMFASKNITQTPSDKKTPANAQTVQTKIDNLNVNKKETKVESNKSLFGLEKEVASQTPDEITSKAIGEFKSWTKKMDIKLENGQVWEVTSSGRLYHPITNPTVTVSKGVLGSFYMGIEGVNRRLKVKRIK